MYFRRAQCLHLHEITQADLTKPNLQVIPDNLARKGLDDWSESQRGRPDKIFLPFRKTPDKPLREEDCLQVVRENSVFTEQIRYHFVDNGLLFLPNNINALVGKLHSGAPTIYEYYHTLIQYWSTF